MSVNGGGASGPDRRKVLIGGAAAAFGGLFWITAPSSPARSRGNAPLEVEVRPVGPQTELQDVSSALRGGQALQHSRMMQSARVSRNLRVIRVIAVDPSSDGAPDMARSGSPERWRAIAYDYDAQRALILEGKLGETAPDRVQPFAGQPIASRAEWLEAREILRRHPYFGPLVRNGDLRAYRPMPPVTLGRGRRRLITVGLLPRIPGDRALREMLPGPDPEHEIVAVDIAAASVHRFPGYSPEGAIAGGGPICGAPEDADEPTNEGEAGQYAVIIRRSDKVIWQFTAIRPSASSGSNGSGIELRNVFYKGRKVLRRAHVPILNVSYKNNICGPYRDWQYQEGRFRAKGTRVAPGFVKTSSAPQTLIESGTDSGNFLGTAIWIHGEEITLVSELEAGWYRYTSQWTLHTNGTIKPRWGFAGVDNTCVCNAHYHHAYWRFEFGLGKGTDNYVERYNGNRWYRLSKETSYLRRSDVSPRLRVRSLSTAAGYEIRPGALDGQAKTCPDWPYSHGDMWALKYRAGQVDDGVTTVRGANTVARINGFNRGQSIVGTDLAVWYAAHFVHDEEEEEEGGHGHVRGPNLLPINWAAVA